MRRSSDEAQNGHLLAAKLFTVPILLCAIASLATDISQPRLIVGPNILVSKGEGFPHVEPIIATDSSDDHRMLGAAMVVSGGAEGPACRIYASLDGGNTWFSSAVPEQSEFGGADPQVGFGLHGTAYFAAIAHGAVSHGGGIYFYRSQDGGKTWSKGVPLGGGDHEEIAVDRSGGRFTGRVYLGFARGSPKPGIYVVHSDDDGQSFSDAIQAAVDPPLGVNVTNPVVFSDGALFVPFISFETDPRKARDIHTRKLSFVISNDGGTTFSQPEQIVDYIFPERTRFIDEYKNGSVVEVTFPEFAVDYTSTHYRDRLYVVWSDTRFGQARILFSSSRDRGHSWSEPRQINADVPAGSSQFQPAIAVNKDGAVGVEWLDTRNSVGGESFDIYFADSADGGEKFDDPVKVSSAPSYPVRAENLKPFAMPARDNDGISLYFLSPFNRWNGGGDYIGLTSDAAGAFRLFWPDARTGAYQLYASTVSVGHGRLETSDVARLPQILTASVELVYDPVQYDTDSREMMIPVRVRNLSDKTVYGPMNVEITAVVRPDLKEANMEDLANIPEILNAANGKTGVGASFDYSNALGTLGVLPPKGVSEAVPWMLRFSHPFVTTFYLKAVVKGYVQPKQ